MATKEERLIPTWSFGDRLRKARTLKGISAIDLSTALGFGKSTVGMWERGAAHPRDMVETARRLGDILDVPYLWLLAGEDAINIRWLAEASRAA